MRAKSSACCDFARMARSVAAIGFGLALVAAVALAQFTGFSAASIERSSGVELSPGTVVEVPVAIKIRKGYHINSNRPLESYLIPTKLSWDAAPLTVKSMEYPEAEEVSYSFSEKPLSVYSSRVVILSSFQVPENIADMSELKGKFRFQACNDKSCLAPKTIDVTIPIRR